MYRFPLRKTKKSKVGNRASSRKAILACGPSDSILHYRGPVVSQYDKENTNTLVVCLRAMTTLSTGAGTTLAQTFPLDNPSGSSNWSTYDAVFDEYRVLASEIHFEPANQYTGASTTTVLPIATVIDRDGSSALSGFNGAEGYGSFEMKNLSRLFHRVYRMSGTREAVFVTTAAPGATGSFLIYAGGLTTATTYGYIVQTWRVQFRGAI